MRFVISAEVALLGMRRPTIGLKGESVAKKAKEITRPVIPGLTAELEALQTCLSALASLKDDDAREHIMHYVCDRLQIDRGRLGR